MSAAPSPTSATTWEWRPMPDRPTPDLPDQLRAWTEAAAAGDAQRVTASAAIARAGEPGGDAAAGLPSPTAGVGRRVRVLLAAAAIIVVVAGLAVAVANRSPSPTTSTNTGSSTTSDVTTTTRTPPTFVGEVPFRILADGPAALHDRIHAHVATSPDALRDLWDDAGFDGKAPDVDFMREVVIAIPYSGGCGTIGSFHQDHDLITPGWNRTDSCLLMDRPFVVVA